MAEEQKLAMAAQLLEQAKEALRNPGEQRKSKLVNSAVSNALLLATSVMEKVGSLEERLEEVEADLGGKLSKEEAQQMIEHHASETQKAQRKLQQEMQRSVKAVESKFKTLKAQVERGAKRGAPAAASAGASGSGAPKPKRERNEYDPAKYTLKGADGQQKTMAAATFADIKDVFLPVKAAKEEPERIKGNPTLNPSNLKAWGIAVDPERLPFNAASGRYIYLSAFLEEGKEKAAQAVLANGEVEAVAI